MHKTIFFCDSCYKLIVHEAEHTTGYGQIPGSEALLCFACCAKEDAKRMQEEGKATLYLVEAKGQWALTNWPGTFRIPLHATPRTGRHNMARVRYDVWFRYANRDWHGVQDTQICHVRQIKSA